VDTRNGNEADGMEGVSRGLIFNAIVVLGGIVCVCALFILGLIVGAAIQTFIK
jgi:hypothetical protein